jgi:hypothetical protein
VLLFQLVKIIGPPEFLKNSVVGPEETNLEHSVQFQDIQV